ncbi:MAG: protein-L-isoaspartate(D-aspartate) O-methyltransferase [Bacteroidales bacterium]|nr:protein-L-isoaspartate(D-aspartate) O-methyltransferase [Bacteroidales bacterium]
MMISQHDSFLARGKRQKLIDGLRTKGIKDENVLEAMNRVPRHIFMDNAFLHHAYQDKAFPISAGQTISQPYTVAVQTELLNVKKHDKILEIGTGSGYQAAILVEMGARVYTIERQKVLYNKAQKTLAKLGYNAHFFYGDGYQGKSQYGPYDSIIITAAISEVPAELFEQLKPGGCLVAPVGGADSQVMTRICKTMEGELEESSHGLFIFVPMLGGTVNGK